MKAINIYKAQSYYSKYEFAGTKNISKPSGKVTFWDGARSTTRTKYVAEDGSIWVKLDGQYHVLDHNNHVVDAVFAE